MSTINPTLITVIFYIIAMISIGLYAYRATSNFDEYILGGRSLGSVVTALSAGASDMSGWLLMVFRVQFICQVCLKFGSRLD